MLSILEDQLDAVESKVECFACHERGHYLRVCPKKQQFQELAAKVTRLAEGLSNIDEGLNTDGIDHPSPPSGYTP